MDKDPKLHNGHYERVREKILRANEQVEQTLMLEMVLQCILPRGDTNEIAKRILKLGDLSSITKNIMPEDLIQIRGIGKNSADKLAGMLRVLYLYLLSFGKTSIEIGPANYYNIIKLLDNYFVGKDR